jgi:hypothetical protein
VDDDEVLVASFLKSVYIASPQAASGSVMPTARPEYRSPMRNDATKDFVDFAEKASTKSLGRALLALGYGTAFAPEMDEGERVVDSPVERRQAPAQQERQAPAPAARPQPQAAQPNGRPFNPMSDVPFRNRCNAINLRMKNEVEDLVSGLYVNGVWDRDGCMKRLEAAEQRAKQPRAAVRA